MTKSHRTRILAKLSHLLKMCCHMGRNMINKPFNQCSNEQWPTWRRCSLSSEAPLTLWLLCLIITNFQKLMKDWNWKKINIQKIAVSFLTSHHTQVFFQPTVCSLYHKPYIAHFELFHHQGFYSVQNYQRSCDLWNCVYLLTFFLQR